MHLTLLCGAHPARCKRGPAVRLQAGRWAIQCDGVKDSSLFITLESSGETISIQHNAEFVLEKPDIIWADFRIRGRESSIIVNVKKVA